MTRTWGGGNFEDSDVRSAAGPLVCSVRPAAIATTGSPEEEINRDAQSDAIAAAEEAAAIATTLDSEGPGVRVTRVAAQVIASWNSQGTVPSRDGAQQAYLRLGTMFHARTPTQTDSTSHVHRAPLIRTASGVTFG